MEAVWSELGTTDVTPEQLSSHLLRKNLLTNYQLDRLIKGERGGYFFGDYKVLYLAGAGTFARVYRAVHKGTGQVVAVKVLRRRFRDDANATEAFLREGRLGSKLRHPNVVPIYDVSDDLTQPYLVMEFVEGRTLREFVKIRKQLTPDEALSLTIDILAGLVHAAEKGMQHRDLKMSNVLVTSRGQAKIVDFGLAAVSAEHDDEDEENAIKTPRTVDYAGLEKSSGKRKDDPRSDLYFVGCMFYNMLTGVPPLSETKERMQRMSISRFLEVKQIGDVMPELNKMIINFVQKSMDLNPDKRFASAAEMLEEARRLQKRLAAGDTGDEIDPTTPEGKRAAIMAAGKTTAKVSSENEGQSRTVMIVESKMDMQDALRERLKKHGYRVLIFSDPERALSRFGDGDKFADCVMFCTPELGEAALEAFNRFGSLPGTENIPAILFVDQRQQEIIQAARMGPSRVLLSMPLKVKELRETLLKLLAQPAA
jgi:serine/threonine-protein kinase